MNGTRMVEMDGKKAFIDEDVVTAPTAHPVRAAIGAVLNVNAHVSLAEFFSKAMTTG